MFLLLLLTSLIDKLLLIDFSINNYFTYVKLSNIIELSELYVIVMGKKSCEREFNMKENLCYDVVIGGGGTAGVAAAIGAAQTGAKVLILERNAYLGGEATNTGVGAFCGIYTCGKNPQKCVAGASDIIVGEMQQLNPHSTEIIISAAGNKNVQYKTEYLKFALDNIMERLGITVLFHTRIISATAENGHLKCLTCADDEGNFTVEGSAFIDATGDANILHLAGAQTRWGEDGDSSVQAATLPFRLCGVDISKDMSPAAVEKAVKKGKEAGIPFLTRERGFIQKITGSQEVIVLLPSIIPTGLSAQELSRLEKETRRQAIYYTEALKRFMPGMEKCELTMIGPSIGFRETRRMLGKQTLKADDVLERRKLSDGVGRGGWKPEIHKKLNEAAVYLDVPTASYYDIPLGCLQARDLDNVYGCGRLVSADAAAMAAVRVMGTCFATGQAAGVAAGLQGTGKEFTATKVREELIRQGALV
jgi:hypothetical protein